MSSCANRSLLMAIQDVSLTTREEIQAQHRSNSKSPSKLRHRIANAKGQSPEHFDRHHPRFEETADLTHEHERQLTDIRKIIEPKIDTVLELLSKPNFGGTNITLGNPTSNAQDPDLVSIRMSPLQSSRRCGRFCNCRCHLSSHLATPRWLQGVFGSLFYSYSGNPVFGRNPCNHPFCHRSGSANTQFIYQFPAWLLLRVLSFTSTWKDVTGAGASWTFRMPTIISHAHPAWSMVAFGRVDQLVHEIDMKSVSPFAVGPNGVSFLEVRLLTFK